MGIFEIDVPWAVFRGPDYLLEVLIGDNDLDPEDDSVDVELRFDDGRRYSATFFTLEYIRGLMEERAQNRIPFGNYGMYFSCPDMIIVKKLTLDVIRETVEDVLSRGMQELVFQPLDPLDPLIGEED